MALIQGDDADDENVGEVRQENLMSIVLGVSSALVIVLLVILITMSIRCGRENTRYIFLLLTYRVYTKFERTFVSQILNL